MRSIILLRKHDVTLEIVEKRKVEMISDPDKLQLKTTQHMKLGRRWTLDLKMTSLQRLSDVVCRLGKESIVSNRIFLNHPVQFLFLILQI